MDYLQLRDAFLAVVKLGCADCSEAGRRAWETVLNAVAAGVLPVNRTWGPLETALLHHAARNASADVMQRLLDLGASPSLRDGAGRVPMHLAANSCSDALLKCNMLPVADCGKQFNNSGHTPLLDVMWDMYILYYETTEHVERLEEVLQWMLDQPECVIDAPDPNGFTPFQAFVGSGRGARPMAMLRAARAERARWSPLRAVWTENVAVTAAAAAVCAPGTW